MSVRRRTTSIALLAAAALCGVALAASPAQAHGALGTPVSRAVECGPLGGPAAMSAACRAADVLSGGSTAFADWDNLRVPNVNGQDRQKIPDGRLCSGGLAAFKGLDLARADWPTTTLVPGSAFTFRYRVTIAHQGSFRLYVTRNGYRPTQPLRWADLAPAPFLTATDPPIQNGAYVMKATLPATWTGRHIIYTIWQTTSTPDTYYSCSDVVFTRHPAGVAPVASATVRPPSATTTPGTAASSAAAVPMAAVSRRTGLARPLVAFTGAVVLIGGAVLLVVRRRRNQVRVRRDSGW